MFSSKWPIHRLVFSCSAEYSTAHCIQVVKVGAHMEFREAIDSLGGRVTHEQAAAALGVSVASVRQYRLSPKAKAHRSPPLGWKQVLANLARRRSRELNRLANDLDGS